MRSGFTLIEILVALAVLAVLGGIAVPITAKVLRAGKEAATKDEMASLGEALRAYAQDRAFSPEQLRWGRFPEERTGGGAYSTILGSELEEDLDGSGWDLRLRQGWNGPYIQSGSETVDADGDGSSETVRGHQVDAWGRYYIYRNRDASGAYVNGMSDRRVVTLVSSGADRDPATANDNLEMVVYKGRAY